MKKVSIVSHCYNEEKNVELLYERIKAVFAKLPQYRYEHIYIDNASSDNTVPVLKRIASTDKNVKIIINNRNFGMVRSPHYALLQAYGDAVIAMSTDLQDPPEVIPQLIEEWEKGAKFVAAVKSESEENLLIYAIRTFYYKLLNSIAQVELIEHFTGFGLYDKTVVDELRKLKDSNPYLRGMVSELGFSPVRIQFHQPKRAHGKSKVNFYHLYDLAMMGFTSQTLVPMRLAVFFGFFMAVLSFLTAFGYFIYKLVYWTSFAVGIAPLVIGMFGFFSIQLMFIGLLGEYIGSINLQVLQRPLVIERERVNFDSDDNADSNGEPSKVESKTRLGEPLN